MKSKTHYDILDVSSSATQSEIKAAYQILVRVWHPDRLHGDLKEIGESKMKLINSAYEVLKDPKQKDAYDSNMRRGQRPQSPTPPSSPSSAHTRPAPTPRTQATSTPPKSAPPKAPPKPPQYGKASKQFRESVVASVDDYFSVLIEENPNHIRDLLIVLNYQIKQEATATWKCEETGENEEPALLRWAQQAKSAGDEAVKLRDQVAYSVNFYYDDLIEKNPTRREDLLSALKYWMFQLKWGVDRYWKSGLSLSEALHRWAYEAKRAGDKKIEIPPSRQSPTDSDQRYSAPKPESAPSPQHSIPQSPEDFILAVKSYYERLIIDHPSQKQVLIDTFNGQMVNARIYLRRSIESEQYKQELWGRWANAAKIAADAKVRKRKP